MMETAILESTLQESLTAHIGGFISKAGEWVESILCEVSDNTFSFSQKRQVFDLCAFEVTMSAHDQVVKILVSLEKADLLKGITVKITDNLGNSTLIENPSVEELSNAFILSYDSLISR